MDERYGRWRRIIFIVCICFFIGIITGALSAKTMDAQQGDRLSEYINTLVPSDGGFIDIFVKHGKYIVAIWLSGFIYSGSILVLIIIFVMGIFYGFSASYSAAADGMGYVIANILPQNAILIPVYLFTAVWTINYILNKFSNNGPKSRILREKRKHLSEHIVILCLCMGLNAVACISEMYAVGLIYGFLN